MHAPAVESIVSLQRYCSVTVCRVKAAELSVCSLPSCFISIPYKANLIQSGYTLVSDPGCFTSLLAFNLLKHFFPSCF
ncbi:hypothetical protein ACHAXM_006319 [Skeletonema potamos]